MADHRFRGGAWVPWVTTCALAIVGHQFALARSQSQSTFSTSSQAIVVDVVVRDHQGRPVTDLSADDFELLEDGVRQQIAAVSLSMPGNLEAATPAATTTSPHWAGGTSAGTRVPITRETGAIALVFDRLSPEARGMAHAAAQTYIDRLAPDDLMGVFLIDRTLDTIQNYTNDRRKLHAAIEEVSRRATSNFRRESYKHETLSSRYPQGEAVNGDNDPSTPIVASAESSGRASKYFDEHEGDGAVAAGMYLRSGISTDRLDTAFERMSRDEQGYTTTTAFMALAHTLSIVPGRKTLIFMAEQLTVPPDVLPHYRDAVAVANRANVSIYAIDCEALRVQSSQMETARYVNGLGMASISAQATGNGSGTLTAMEMNEDVLRRDPRVMLTMLTRDTGGFLINNTNDLAGGLQRLDADRRFHYLLTYAPTNNALDGTYRHITVRVRRSSTDVRARDGYLAVPQLLGMPVLQRDALAVAALAQVPRPRAIPIQALALQFRDDMRAPLLALVIDVPRQGVMHRVEAGATTFQTEFTIYARIVSDRGEVVRQASQQYHLSGRAADRDRAQRGDVVFYRQPTLPAGHYTLEFVVVDTLGRQAGSGSQALEVIDPGRSQPDASSLLIVRAAEQLPAAQQDRRNPLQVDGLLLSPNVSAPLHKASGTALTFFYTAYPVDRPLSATLELADSSKTIAHLPLKLPPVDTTGRIQHLARVPLADVPPGSYDLRVILTDGTMQIVRTASFVLLP
jgi:VWFA-related protein